MNLAIEREKTSPLERVLVLVNGARDGELTKQLLLADGLDAAICKDMPDLAASIEEGAAVAILAEEVLTPASVDQLGAVLGRQAPWSDFPIMVFSGAHERALRSAPNGILGNVTFLDRPVQVRSMLASVRAAIRSRRRQYEARRAIESRDAFLAMLGHELRNPLGAIRLAITRLDARVPAQGRSREHAIIDRQSNHLTRLVDDLLDVARVTHGKVVLKREPVNLATVAASAFETLETRAREQHLAYTLCVADPNVWIDGDRQRLEQVFSNLLTNAIKYTPAGGRVSVDVRAEDESAVVRVTDTGIGLPDDMLGRIFDTFAQVDASLDRSQGGIGLGLALVRSVVQLHGGTIEAASAGVGHGTSFVLRLRRVRDFAPAAVEASDRDAAQPSPKRVVVVEDSADIRDLLVELLQEAGHQVAWAEDGPQGLERILEVRPDIAFVDVGLPGFDGFEVARRARCSGSAGYLVAITGYGQPQDRKRAADAGFDDHMTKPVGYPDIVRAMWRSEGPRTGATAADPEHGRGH